MWGRAKHEEQHLCRRGCRRRRGRLNSVWCNTGRPCSCSMAEHLPGRRQREPLSRGECKHADNQRVEPQQHAQPAAPRRLRTRPDPSIALAELWRARGGMPGEDCLDTKVTPSVELTSTHMQEASNPEELRSLPTSAASGSWGVWRRCGSPGWTVRNGQAASSSPYRAYANPSASRTTSSGRPSHTACQVAASCYRSEVPTGGCPSASHERVAKAVNHGADAWTTSGARSGRSHICKRTSAAGTRGIHGSRVHAADPDDSVDDIAARKPRVKGRCLVRSEDDRMR